MKFSPQIHPFLCLALLAELAAPALVRADPPQSNVICGRINTARAMVDEAERKKSRERLFGSWKDLLEKTIGDRHRTSHLATAAANSVQAQNNFLYFLQSKTIEICDIQLGAELGMKDLSQKISETSALSDKAQMCGRFDQLQAGYKKSHDGMTTVNGEMSKKLEALKTFFVDSANTNLSNLDQIPEAGTKYLVPGPVVPRTMWQRFFGGGSIPKLNKAPSLREEAAAIWGNNAKGLQKNNFQPDPNSLFGGIMSRLGNDLKASNLFAKRLETQNAKIQELQKNCGVIAPNQVNPDATLASDQSDITGVKSPTELHPQKDADLDPDAAQKAADATQQPVVESSETPGSLVETPPADDDGKPDPYDPDKKIGDEDVLAGAQPPPPKVKEEGWISKNKGLLLTVGAGAAAVGGILWYKNSQDKKAEQDASVLEMEARALASSQSSSGSDSDSGSTSESTTTDSTVGGTPANESTPQGSKLILSGLPSSASVNTTLSEITVAILNPSGILTQDSHTDITVSCAEPANCSLAGTLTVNTDAGKAKFNDLRFTNADQNVKLQFSAPGFEPVAAGAFNVTGGESTRE